MNITMSLSQNITIRNPNKIKFFMKMEKLSRKKIYISTEKFKKLCYQEIQFQAFVLTNLKSKLKNMELNL